MSVMKRVSMIFRAKANKALDRMEDPRETLDYSYQRQLEMLTQVRRGVADVATSRKRVELQMNSLRKNQSRLEGQAKQALGAGREDLAREALGRKAALQSQLTDLANPGDNGLNVPADLTALDQRIQQLEASGQITPAQSAALRAPIPALQAGYASAVAGTTRSSRDSTAGRFTRRV